MGVHWLIQSLWCLRTWGKFFKAEIRWPLMLERGKTTASYQYAAKPEGSA